MARISTGNTYGDTTRRTSQRLLGGEELPSLSGAIDVRPINAPAISPQANPVNTFVQTGAPTIGGPVAVPRPPDLPAPNGDLGRLAQALGGFSPVLQQVGESYVNYRKQQEEQLKRQGQAIAQEVSMVGGSTLQEVQKRLEKGVAEGAAGYDAMLRRFRAMDPRALYYADYYTQLAALDTAVATLPERWKQTKQLNDGRARDSASSDDPEVRATLAATLFPGGAGQINPMLYAERSQQINAAYGSALAQQDREHALWKTDKAQMGLSAATDSAATQVISGTVPADQIAAGLSKSLNDYFSGSGQTAEEYRKQRKDLPKALQQAVVMATGGDWGKMRLALGRLPEVLVQVRAGPNGEPLIRDQAELLEVTNDLMKGVVEQQNLQDSLEQRDSSEQLSIDLQQVLTPEVLNNPVALEQTEEAMMRRGAQLYPKDPEKRLAYEEGVRKQFASLRGGYVQPVQEKNEVALWAEMAQNPAADFTQRILELQQSGQISYNAAKGFLQSQAARNREDNKANYQVLRGLQQDLQKRLEEQFKRGSSEGGANLTPDEAKQLWALSGQLYQAGDSLIRKAPGQDLTTQLGEVYSKALQQALPQPRQQAPAGATPESISKGLVLGGRGNAQQNAALRRKAETQPLYAKERMGQQLDQVLSGKPLDDATRQIIRRSGMKPSDFFSRQMQLHGVPLDGETQKRLQELDGGDLVSQAPAAEPSPLLASALRFKSQVANGLLNTLIPPAAAATRSAGPFTGSKPTSALAFNQIPGGKAKLAGLAQLTRAAGFPANEAATMVAIAMAESGGRADAHNNNRSTGDDSYGLWQINMIDDLGPERRRQFGISSNSALWDPNINAQAARKVRASQGFSAWSVYRSGAYKQYLPAAQQVVRQVFSSR